jgi:hypothetical protein
LEKALAELTGIVLTTGVLKSATIEKTKDGKDYKAVFQKTSRTEFLAGESEPGTRFTAVEPVVVNNYSKQKDPLVAQAEELVCSFHKTFHNVDSHAVQSKETAQAVHLITQFGFENAKKVVEFAHGEAAKTKYAIQHFGGIISYASRALAASSRRVEVPTRQTAAVARRDSQQQSWPKGERRLACLALEESKRRFEDAKEGLFERQPFLAQTWKADSQLHQRMIHQEMVRRLDLEPMDLLPLHYLPDWAKFPTQIWAYNFRKTSAR